jgi:predicted MPP superfamily phosphohydrolase
LLVAAGTAIPLAAYSQFIEPHHLTTERLEFAVKNLPSQFEGFRIAQLSDFHYGPFTGEAEIAAAVDVAASYHPDMLVLTGDFVTVNGRRLQRSYTDVVLCARILTRLKTSAGIFACLGNHDVAFDATYISEVLSGFGIITLRNASTAIERGGQRLWIAGVDDAMVGRADFQTTLSKIPASEPVVLIAHEPDLADEAARYPNLVLQLSGHSHGGQIRLPILGAPYLPPLAEKYPFGLYRVRHLNLYTNRGIGTILLPYRFNAPPEVTIVTLKGSAGA